jgi:hypothetical protein
MPHHFTEVQLVKIQQDTLYQSEASSLKRELHVKLENINRCNMGYGLGSGTQNSSPLNGITHRHYQNAWFNKIHHAPT